MNTTDKVCKEAFSIFSFVKEQTVNAIVHENSNQRISLSETDLERIVNVLNSTYDTAIQRALNNFQKQVSKIIDADSETSKKKK